MEAMVGDNFTEEIIHEIFYLHPHPFDHPSNRINSSFKLIDTGFTHCIRNMDEGHAYHLRLELNKFCVHHLCLELRCRSFDI